MLGVLNIPHNNLSYHANVISVSSHQIVYTWTNVSFINGPFLCWAWSFGYFIVLYFLSHLWKQYDFLVLWAKQILSHCRCGNNFCATHRYAESHSCTFDYKTEGRKLLEQNNPVVNAPKLPKIWQWTLVTILSQWQNHCVHSPVTAAVTAIHMGRQTQTVLKQ